MHVQVKSAFVQLLRSAASELTVQQHLVVLTYVNLLKTQNQYLQGQ